ncbi:hypothetical protein [Marinobacter salsuginis]|nr:hypothetical protein [Marinobacter salsuginis]
MNIRLLPESLNRRKVEALINGVEILLKILDVLIQMLSAELFQFIHW